MKQLQLFFNEESKSKKEKSELQESFKNALKQNQKYLTLAEDIQELTAERKQIELAVMEELGISEELDDLKRKINETKQIITDKALSDFMQGKTVEVEDQFGNRYEPVWSVKFKKTGMKNFTKKNA